MTLPGVPKTFADVARASVLGTASNTAAAKRELGSEVVGQAADNIVMRARAERAVMERARELRKDRPDRAAQCFAAMWRDEQERFHVWLVARCGVTEREMGTIRSHSYPPALRELDKHRGTGLYPPMEAVLKVIGRAPAREAA